MIYYFLKGRCDILTNPVYFGNLFPQVKTMLTACVEGESDIIHEKYSYTYRVFVITEGSCSLIIDQDERLCRTGDAVFLCPHQKYTTIFHPTRCSMINLAFGFSDKLESRIPRNSPQFLMRHTYDKDSPERYSEQLEFADLPAFNSSFMISGIPDAVKRITEMYKLFLADDLFSHLRLSSSALGFIADLAEYETGMNSRVRNDLAHRILDYIDTHYTEHLTCGSIAEVFSYHPSYISRTIRSYTGFSLHDYITRRKIREATRLLIESNLSMTEIAYRLSFYDSSHFSKVYQAHTGMSPSEVRKNN